MTSREILEKATITTAAFATNGLLLPEQSNKFIDYVIDESSMKNIVRNVRVSATQRIIDKINVGNRVAVPKEEAVDPGVRRGVSTSGVTLQPREIMVPFEVSDILKETNIERDGIEDTLIRMMANRLANNVEQLGWDGCALGPAVLEGDIYEGGSTTLYCVDSFLGLYNGWLRAAQGGHVVDALGANISANLLSRALNAMPNKFRKNKAQMKFMLSPDHEQAYRETVSSRQTQSGDNALAATGNIPAFGVELIPVSLLDPNPQFTEHVVANADGVTATTLGYAPISNLVITRNTLARPIEAGYVLGVDYAQNLVAGTFTRLGGGMAPGATVKTTYRTGGRILLTNPQNMIFAIGRDIRIEKGRDIYKGVDQFAITAKIFHTFEELDAVVLLQNVAVPA